MKFSAIFFALLFILASPLQMALAAQEAPAEKTEPAKTEKQSQDVKEKQENKNDKEFSCRFYDVKLPEGWTVIMPPDDQLGTINAIFATSTGSSVVTMIIGPNGGADIRTVADMFAEQFKAPKKPTLKNGQYVFDFPLQDGTAQAIISSMGEEFMVTTLAGNQKEARVFLKDAVTSEKWSGLLPK